MRDLGGQILYLNSTRRWGWGVNLERIPYLLGYASVSNTPVEGSNGQTYNGTAIDYVRAHLAVSGGSLLTQYARSQTQRLELSAGYTRYDYAFESQREIYVGNSLVSRDRATLDSPPALGMVQGAAALVGDDASFGLTSPIAGTRYRLEVAPSVGSLTYQSVLLDFRRYVFFKPFTLALRGMHYGRYGRDSDSDRLGYVFLGDGSLVRGYSYESFTGAECLPSGSGGLATSSCPQFDRLLGSRVALANVELRIPLLGQRGFGLVQTILPPLEIAPFLDAGVAWTGSSSPSLRLASSSSERTPVMSAGIATRLNLLGFAVLEVYVARPFQRPGRGNVFGFLLQPGW
jgi:hypothetical protein